MKHEYGTLFSKGSKAICLPFEEDVCLMFDDTSCMNDSWKTLIVVPAGSDVVECVNKYFNELIPMDRAILELLGVNNKLSRREARALVLSYAPESSRAGVLRKLLHRECVITGLTDLKNNTYRLEIEY